MEATLLNDIDAFHTKDIESDNRLKAKYIKAAKLLSEFRSGSKSASEVFDTDRLSKFCFIRYFRSRTWS